MGITILAKGERTVIQKSDVITARCSWDSKTDYDLYALVLLKDGTTETVATFGARKGGFLGFGGKTTAAQTSILGGAVRHLGDVQREAQRGEAQETIEIRLTPDILAVVPVAYSAQSNGTGSFRKYKVSLEIDNGNGEKVSITSANASGDNRVYTCAIGVIKQTAEGVQIQALESYSARNSEHRPALELGKEGEVLVHMDQGPKNDYK